ncbi:hypothetical protein FEM48_Zijuj12G0122000 [Ziziphus jujuba var. spinosa]|uniref:non-specific serine/threonine protein kinase n=1 Tax=Ziziphus jujuba var. spinosa TaxID=714518 RepID=A0A978UD92_ZIZJJ|nr:hypothetical protein FEM48_Zijuj12G0122000 [Ziziphus jujuba var. spinosa]
MEDFKRVLRTGLVIVCITTMEVRIDGNRITGSIPSFIGNWTKLKRLRISDLTGSAVMTLPDLKNVTKLKILILRNCSLSGSIPDYIGQNMNYLGTLDLSFNNLTGEIPVTLKDLGTGKQKHVFLTNNSLSKVDWSWITSGDRNWDLSYNNFTERPSSIDCTSMSLNLVCSYLSFENQSCKIVPILVYGIVVWNCFTGFGIHAQLLPQDEVRSLQAISKALKLENIWNVSETSCNRIAEDFNVTKVAAKTSVLGNVTQLKGLNLTGDLPAEFGNLTSLEELDLTRNSISGSIPASLSRAPLRILSLLGNRLTGTIPKEIGDISTLRVLVLEQNQLGGSLPEEIGNLRNLERLVLSANNFTGTIPPTLGNLKNLTDFRIDGNKITGSIPSFIGNWTKLDRLDMQGTSMEGPIPSNISLLSNLVQLRISDLTGPVMAFPDLKNVTKLKRLILRNCSLTGSIPGFIGQNMTDLNTLDLSFNNLTGEIPDTLKSLGTGKQKHVFLTNNSLSKVDWSWITNGERNWDLSYNNFTERPSSVDCTFLNLNLVSSYSSFETQSTSPVLKHKGGNVVLKDYNIVERAGGVGKSVTETFDATVHGSTLEIHLYWVGKGTSAIPYAGVYGPLISAITITKIEGQGLSVGAIIGIVAASCVLVILILLVLRITGYLGGKQNEDPEYVSFDCFEGVLSDGGVIAVKQLSAKSKQGNREFINEVGMISALEHPNLAYVLQERGKLLDLVDPSLGSNYSKEEALTMLNLGLLCTNTSPSLRPTMTSVVSMLEQKTPVPEQIMRRISVEQDARLRAFEKLSQDSMTQSSTVSHDSHQIGISMDGPWVDSSFSIQSKDDRHENSSTSKLL